MELCAECEWESNFLSKNYHLRYLKVPDNLRLGKSSREYQQVN